MTQPGSGAVRRAPVVVGRGPELDRLLSAVHDARSGTPASIFLVGEGGVGKTRLLSAVADEARQIGLPVISGRAPVAAPAPFSIVAEALRSWLRAGGARRTAPAPPPLDAGLRLIVPEWPDGDGPATTLSDGQLQLLALEGLVWITREIGAVVILDDLHGADPESLEAVRYLATAASPRVLVAGALRSAESPQVERAVRALQRDGVASVIDLVPLDPGAVADLLGALMDAEPPPELVADVVGRTDGVPLLVEEVLEAHLRAGSVELTDAGALWRGGPAVVPATVLDTVEGRLDRLPDAHRDVLAAGAVLGDFDVGLLSAVAQQPAQPAGDAIRAGVDVGLLEAIAGTVGFRHALVREAVLEATLPHVRETLHRRAAGALSETDGGDDPLVLERRARHLQEVADDTQAASLLAAASSRRLAEHALLGAESLAREAVELAGSSAAAAPAADSLARALAAQGRWAEALALDEATSKAHGESAERWRRMASCAIEWGQPDLAAPLLARAAEQGDDSPATAVLSGRLALTAGDGEAALRCAEEAVRAALAQGDVATACSALDLKGRALDFAGRRADAIAAWTEQAERAEQAGLTDARMRAVVLLAKMEVFEGKPPVRLYEACELTRSAGAFVEQAQAEENLAIALTLQGNPRAGLAVATATARRCRELRLDTAAYLVAAQGGCHSLIGEHELAEALLDEAEAMSPEGDLNMKLTVQGIHGDMALRSGRVDEAVEWLQAATDTYRALPGSMPTDAPAWLAVALASAGRTKEASEALEFARSVPDPARWHARPVIVAAAAALIDGSPDAVDEAMASATGRMPFDLALIRELAAKMLDAPQKGQWLRDALEAYEAAGDSVDGDRIRRLLREAGEPVPRRKRRPEAPVPDDLARHGVTTREAEVLRLLGDGLSNADIAARLYVSVRTVESHVSSLLTKLGVDSRGKLTAISAATPWEASA